VKLNVEVESLIDLQALVDNAINDESMTQVHQAFADAIDPWVPKITGKLSQSGLSNCDADGVHYNVDYAEKEYYAHHQHRTDKHPLASSQWDKVAMETQRDNFAEDVKSIIVDKLGANS